MYIYAYTYTNYRTKAVVQARYMEWRRWRRVGLRWCGSIRALLLPGITKLNPQLSKSSSLDVRAPFC
jgi:hypothetical protein